MKGFRLNIPRDTPEQEALYQHAKKMYDRSGLCSHACPLVQVTRQAGTGIGYSGHVYISHIDLETRPYEIRMMPEPQIIWLDAVMENRTGCKSVRLPLSRISQYSRIISGALPL